MIARPATSDAQELVALALDAAKEAMEIAAETPGIDASRYVAIHVLGAILSAEAAPASDLLDAMLDGADPDVLAAL